MIGSWKKLTITAEADLLEIISADIIHISNGIIEEINNHIHFIEYDDIPLIKKKILKYKNKKVQFQFKEQIKEDWHLAWKDNFTQIEISDKLLILPDWENLNSSKKVIKIKPGMAFGTGHHDTTFLILQELVGRIKPKMSVLDLGSGSGVLSIAAKKLGAENVTAVEFDKECKENFYENLSLNNLKNEVSIYFQDVLEWANYDFDIILANLNKSVINKLIPILSKNSNSEILLTGILIDDKKDLIKLIEKFEFNINMIRNKGEWIIISINKII